jgi:hypothetical protein
MNGSGNSSRYVMPKSAVPLRTSSITVPCTPSRTCNSTPGYSSR